MDAYVKNTHGMYLKGTVTPPGVTLSGRSAADGFAKVSQRVRAKKRGFEVFYSPKDH
jgi:hypothetical protein